jgi:hypothetical protein
MRAWPCLALAVAVALAGCAYTETPDRSAATPAASLNPAVYGPRQASPAAKIPIPHPHALPPAPGVARALAGGEVGVVDTDGHVGVRPRTLATAQDGGLEKLTWQHWGPDGAEGRGELQVNSCNPSCAMGGDTTIPATISLSAVRTCDGRRYFDAAELRTADATAFDGQQPVAYVRAPC